MKQYSVQYIQLSTGETMAYRHCGNGPRNLVLIHGNMGMPYPEGGVNILNINLDAPEEVIAALTQRLGILPGVSVKATYARCDLFEGRERRDQPGTD